MLERFPAVAKARLKLVPSRLSEEDFWQRYFALVRESVLLTISNS